MSFLLFEPVDRQFSKLEYFIPVKWIKLENVKCFKHLGSMLTDDGRCTCEIKSRLAMARAAFNKKKNFLPANWT